MKKLKCRIRFLFRSVSVRIVAIMILLVIPLNAWNVFTSLKMRDYMYAETKGNIYNIGRMAAAELDRRMKAADTYLMETLPGESTFFQTVLSQGEDAGFYHAAYNLHDSLRRRALSGDSADVFFIYAEEKEYTDIVFNSQTDADREAAEAELEKMIRNGGTGTGGRWMISKSRESDGGWLVRFIRRGHFFYGAMIDMRSASDKIAENMTYETADVCFFPYGSDTLQMEETSIVTNCGLEEADAEMVLSVNKDEITGKLPFLQRIGPGIAVIFCGVLPVIIFFLYRWLIRPVKILRDAMGKVQEGDQEYQIHEKALSNEFRILFDSFNRMITAQRRMNEEIIERETYAKKLEIRTLQLQIRPHFLLNSFNLLYGLVTMKKIENSQRMILYLSDYFRYIFKSGQEMELYERELALIVDYISVARLRYPFISFEEEHDETVLKVMVPPLLIHNFIENVLKHGLKPKGITSIRLNAFYDGTAAHFVVSDDGRGMDEEFVRAVNSGNFDRNVREVHVGLQNASQRIHHSYGPDGKMEIESQPGQGTRIKVILPCQPEEGEGEKDAGTDIGR